MLDIFRAGQSIDKIKRKMVADLAYAAARYLNSICQTLPVL